MAESYFGELRTAVLRKEICIFPPTTSSYHRVIPVSDSQLSGPWATPLWFAFQLQEYSTKMWLKDYHYFQR